MKDFTYLKNKALKMMNKGFPVCFASIGKDDDFALLTYPLVSEEEEELMMLSICLLNGQIHLLLEKASWVTISHFGKHVLLEDENSGEILVESFFMHFHDEPTVCTRKTLDKAIYEIIKEYQNETGYKLKKVDKYFLLELLDKYAPNVRREYTISEHALSFDDLLPFLREMEKELPNFHVIDNRNAAG